MSFRLPRMMMVLAGCALGMGCVSTVHHGPVYTPTAVPAAVPVGAEGEPFYDDLAPYGDWVHVSGPGWVWVPYDTPVGWRPYQLGYWVYTDYGWTWASDEVYGHVVYHYGRWHSDPAYGWVWVPGADWGPAWVAWHEGGGYVGWAPLPYQVRWQVGVGLDWGGVSVDVALGPSWWHFVPTRYMVAPTLDQYIVPVSRNVTLIRTTQHVTNYIYVNNRIVDHGVKADKVGRAVGHTIPRYRVRPADPHERGRGGHVQGNDFVVDRPAPVRGAKSPGRAVPPGGGRSNRPGDQRRGTMSPPPDASEAPTETTISEPGPPPEKIERHPSRHSRDPRQPRAEAPAPYPPVATPASAQPTESDRPSRPAPPVRTRPENPAGGNPADGNSAAERPGGNPQPGRHGTVGPEPDRPAPPKAAPPASGRAKKPAAKAKGKGSGEAVAKPGKVKPDASSSEESDSDKKKSDDKGSGNEG